MSAQRGKHAEGPRRLSESGIRNFVFVATSRDIFVKQVLEFIRRHRLLEKDVRIVVGMSGGVDSLVLADVLQRAGYHIGVAHVNFKLRGGESDEDARFVEAWAKRNRIPFHLLEAPAKVYAKAHRKGVQEAAREIRYKYFEQLRKEHGYDAIAVAHHGDDAVETFFMHLIRGAGLRGLSSIPERQGVIVRPLLGVSRAAIEAYARRRKLVWREDSSNREEFYERNRVRKQLLPKLKSLSPTAPEGMARSLEHLRFAREVFETAVARMRKRWFSMLPDGTRYLSLSLLRESTFGEDLLYELLRGTGFEPGEPGKVLRAARSGTRFKTASGYLAVDRNRLMLVPFRAADRSDTTIGERTRRVRFNDGALAIYRKSYRKSGPIPSDRGEHWLDAGKLAFPLIVRTWRPGDRFRPLGMQGSRKLSDYLTDRKLSVTLKEKVRVVLSEGRIVCILGERISEEVRITDSTRKVLRLQWSPLTKP